VAAAKICSALSHTGKRHCHNRCRQLADTAKAQGAKKQSQTIRFATGIKKHANIALTKQKGARTD